MVSRKIAISTYFKAIFLTSVLLFQVPAVANGLLCSQLFSDAGPTFSKGGLSFRFQTYFEWSNARAEFRSLVKSPLETAEAYAAFFSFVKSNQEILTEKRFFQVFKELPMLDSQSNLKTLFYENILSLAESNRFSNRYKLLGATLSKLPIDDILSGPGSPTFKFLMGLAQKLSLEDHPFIETAMVLTGELVNRGTESQSILMFLNDVKTSSQQIDLKPEDLTAITSYLKDIAKYRPSAKIKKWDVIDLMTGSWGSQPLKSLQIMTDAQANKAMQTVVTDSQYTQDRPLFGEASYSFGFVNGFRSAIMGLRSDQVWLDSGAGQFHAIREYFAEGGKAQVIGISIETSPQQGIIRRLQNRYSTRFQALLGSPIEKYSAEQLGKVDLITDFYGAFSYSPHPDVILRKYLDILNQGGRIDLFLKNPSTVIYLHDTAFSLIDWLGTVQGIEFWTRAEPSGATGVSIRKTGAQAEVPLLNLFSYEMNLPATRGYFIQK